MASPRVLQLAFELAGKLKPEFMDSAKKASAQLVAVKKEADKVNKAADVRAAAKSWKEFGNSAKGVKHAFAGVTSEIKGTLKTIAGIATGQGLIGGAIYGVAKSSANYADKSIKTAKGIGMATESYTELAYAAKLAGASEEQFAKGSGKLNKLVFDAAAGQEKALNSFKRLDLDYRDEEGKLKSVERLWGEVSDVIAAIPDEAARVDLARELFGEEDARRLVPFLSSGKKGIDEMREAAKKLNITLSEQDGKNAEAFNDSFANIGESIRGATLILGKKMWPTLTKVHEYISSKILDAAGDLSEAINDWDLTKWWDEARPKLDEAWEFIKKGAKDINDFANRMGGWIPLIQKIVKYWLIWRGVKIAGEMIKTAKSIKTLAGSFLDLQHKGTTIRGVLHRLFKGSGDIPKEGLKPFTGNLRKSLSGAFSGAYSSAANAARNLGKYIKDKLAKSFAGVSTVAKSAWKTTGKVLSRDTLSRAAGGVKSAGSAVKDYGAKAAKVTANAFRALPGVLKNAGTAVKGFSRSTWDGVTAAASFSKTLMVDTGKGVASFASTIAAKALPMLSGLAAAMYSGAAAALSFGAALLANPITWVIAGIVALGAAVYLCIKHWDKIKAAVSAAWESIKGVFVAGWNLLPDWVQGPILKVVDAVAAFGQKVWAGIKKDWDSITGVFSAAWDGIVNAAKAFGGMLSDAFSAVWSAVTGLFTDKFDAISGAFENSFIGGLLETAKQFNPLSIFIDAFTKVKDWLMQFDMVQAGVELAKKLGDGILNALSGIGEKVKSAVIGWIPGGESIVNAAGAAKDAVSGAASTAWSAVTGFFGGGETEAIPAMANGGIVTRPQLTMIGEAGPEVVIPVTRAARARELMGKAAEMMGILPHASVTETPRKAAPFGGMMRGAAAAGLTALLSAAPVAAAPASMPDVNVLNAITAPVDGGSFAPVMRMYGGEKTSSVTNHAASYAAWNQSWLSNIANAAGSVSALNTWFGDTANAATSSTMSSIYGDDNSNMASSFSTVGGDVLRNIISTVTLAGQSIPAFADGGFVDSPQLALVGEAGPEMIVPLTRENRARGLMGAAAEFMGWSGGDDNGRGGDTFQITFSPTIHVNGGDGGVRGQVRQGTRESFRDLERFLDDWWERKQRNSTRTRNDR